MDYLSYLWMVLKLAWQGAWSVVTEHSIKTLLRDAVILTVTLGALRYLQPVLTNANLMSEDNVSDTIIWIVGFLISAVAVFALIFVVQGVLVVPYRLWREQKQRIFGLLPDYEKKRLGPLAEMASPANQKLRERLGTFACEYLDPAFRALNKVQLSLVVQCKQLFGGPSFGEACVNGIMDQTVESSEDISDLTYPLYLERQSFDEAATKTHMILQRYEKAQTILCQSLDYLVQSNCDITPETRAKLAEWKAMDEAMYEALDELKGMYGMVAISQIQSTSARNFDASKFSGLQD